MKKKIVAAFVVSIALLVGPALAEERHDHEIHHQVWHRPHHDIVRHIIHHTVRHGDVR